MGNVCISLRRWENWRTRASGRKEVKALSVNCHGNPWKKASRTLFSQRKNLTSKGQMRFLVWKKILCKDGCWLRFKENFWLRQQVLCFWSTLDYLTWFFIYICLEIWCFSSNSNQFNKQLLSVWMCQIEKMKTSLQEALMSRSNVEEELEQTSGRWMVLG